MNGPMSDEMSDETNGAASDVADGGAGGAVPAGRYEADVTHSSVTWRIKHFGLAWYTGRFTRFSASLDFDPVDVEAMRLAAEVDVRSVRTDYAGPGGDWDGTLGTGEHLLDGARNPTARFVSTAVRRTGEDTADVTGDMTLRGITRPVTLATTFNGGLLKDPFERTLVGFSARGILTRTEFGLDYFLGPLMPDAVQLIIETEMALQGQPAAAAA